MPKPVLLHTGTHLRDNIYERLGHHLHPALGIEPLQHPMGAGDRSVIVTLRQVNDLPERFWAKQVGVVINVYHVW